MSQDTTRYVTEEEMDSTPTGLNMRLGTFVIPFADSDPTSETRDVADGTTRLWLDGSDLKMSVFSLGLGSWTTFSEAAETSVVEEVAETSSTFTFISAQEFILSTGTPDIAVRGSGNTYDRFPGWALDAAADESVTAATVRPTGDSYAITLLFACPNGNAGDVYISMFVGSVLVDTQIDQSGSAFGEIITVPGVTDQMFTSEYSSSVGASPGDVLRITVYRNSTSISDTYASDVWFLGAIIST